MAIYCIRNLKSGKQYIGSTNDWDRRRYEHLINLKNNSHINDKLQRDWNKFGSSSFDFRMLKKFDDSIPSRYA